MIAERDIDFVGEKKIVIVLTIIRPTEIFPAALTEKKKIKLVKTTNAVTF